MRGAEGGRTPHFLAHRIRKASPGDRGDRPPFSSLACGHVPTLGSQLLPNFKERDFLIALVDQPGTSVTEETRVSISGLQGSPRDLRAYATAAPIIGQAYLADEVYGRGLR
jgi:hypothetical protein